MESKTTKVNRFTRLPVLLDILLNKRLLFSDPKFWDDKNDSELLEIYKKKKKINTVLALCFLNDHETVHHWKAFADGICGCCIEFDKVKLTELLAAHKSKGVKFGSVVYRKITDVGYETIDECADMIPFIKRWPYRFEKEFRAIWEGSGTENPFEIRIEDLSIITKITLSPTMPETLFSTTKGLLLDKILQNPTKPIINQSTVYKNEDWIKKFSA